MTQPAGRSGCGGVTNRVAANASRSACARTKTVAHSGGAMMASRSLSSSAVEAEDGVVVHDAAPLVLGDLAERHPGGRRPSGPMPGDGPVEGDGRAPPQLPRPGVPDGVRVVVVAVRAQRLTEPGVVSACWRPQDSSRPCGQTGRRRSGRQARTLPDAASTSRECTGPKRRGGQGGEDGRVAGDTIRDALAAAEAGEDQLVGVGPVGLGAGRADGGPAVAAGLVDHAVLAADADDRDQLARAGVDTG